MLELQQDDAAQQDMGNYQPFCMGPSALGVDDAISAVQESIDWMRLRSYSLPGDCAPASCLAIGPAACTAAMLAEGSQQDSETLASCMLLRLTSWRLALVDRQAETFASHCMALLHCIVLMLAALLLLSGVASMLPCSWRPLYAPGLHATGHWAGSCEFKCRCASVQQRAHCRSPACRRSASATACGAHTGIP